MKKAIITDVTLRKGTEAAEKLSFKERTETAKLLDRLGADIIEVGGISDRADTLFLHTISPIIKNSTISCCAGLTAEQADEAFAALSECASKRLYISIPASTVQMEYVCGKKSAAMLELIDIMTKKCVSLCPDSEIALLDATRSEKEFLYSAINTAVANGIKNITLCDNAGDMLPDEMSAFVSSAVSETDIDDSISLFVECSDKLGLGTALAAAAVGAGASGVKAGFCNCGVTDLAAFASVISAACDRLGFSCGIDMTALSDTEKKIRGIIGNAGADGSVMRNISHDSSTDDIVLSENDTITEITSAIQKLGYELSDEDNAHVFEEFRKVAAKKQVGMTELDAIIASVALQVPSTYKVKSYVINSGNVITATAHVTLSRGEEILSGISTGDGPVDAAFRAIEQIIGHHYDLDDFQIQSLTEGKEAVGSSIVKLRSGSGKLYSGKGVSTDILGAAIKAYINALNKIFFEEA